MPYPQPQWTPGRVYDPTRMLGALHRLPIRGVQMGEVQIRDAAPAAACPTRSYWWLALAGVVGAVAGYKYSAPKKRGGRKG